MTAEPLENVVRLRRPTPQATPARSRCGARPSAASCARRGRSRAARSPTSPTRPGVSIQYLSEVERGLKEPSSEILGAVSGALGLRLVDLTIRVARSLQRISGPVCLAA